MAGLETRARWRHRKRRASGQSWRRARPHRGHVFGLLGSGRAGPGRMYIRATVISRISGWGSPKPVTNHGGIKADAAGPVDR
jgi:hypothetical protein